MLSLRRGRVTAIVEEHDGLVRLEVDGAPCVAYVDVTGPVAVGDDVVVNVQARELGLGSGGFDVLHVNLTRGLGLGVRKGAHVMKLPYTPLQFAVPHAEEAIELPGSLDGLPVVACSLHSQVAPVCAALVGARVAYVQVPGGALPLVLSDSVRELAGRGLVDLTISVGACFGGELECVNVYSALAVAAARGADAVVCTIGPGIVGTGTTLGHGGMAAAHALDAAVELGGEGILALRISEHDSRPRHRGVSHHTRALLGLNSVSFHIPWPAGCPVEDPIADGATDVEIDGWRGATAGLTLSHMGRGPEDDPWFFASAYAAGVLARTIAEGRSAHARRERVTDT
jgi:Protein of unknown function (DUF3866)